jgi:hypothetical protein
MKNSVVVGVTDVDFLSKNVQLQGGFQSIRTGMAVLPLNATSFSQARGKGVLAFSAQGIL